MHVEKYGLNNKCYFVHVHFQRYIQIENIYINGQLCQQKNVTGCYC